VSNSTNYSSSDESNTNIQKVLNNQELMKSINSAYDKTVEVLNKTSQEVEKEAKAVNKSTTKQTNILSLKNAVIKDSAINLTQSNKLVKTVALSASLQFINEVEADNKTKAIVADMLGVSQGTEAVQNAIQNAAQLAANVQESKQETTQDTTAHFTYREKFFNKNARKKDTFIAPGYLKESCLFGCASVATTVSNQGDTQLSNLHNYTDNLQDNSIRSQEIQNYVSTLSDKTQNINEYKSKISQTIENAADSIQENIADLEGANFENVELTATQTNDLVETITNGFDDFMTEVKQTVGDTSLEDSTKIQADQKDIARQTGEQISSQTSDNTQKSSQSTDQTTSAGSNIIMTIVICIIAVVGLCVVGNVLINRKKEPAQPPAKKQK
jgi:hypothetical protein